jgi:hypothetical protein
MPITGGSILDNSVAYRTATDADPGGSRDTFDHWKTANEFPGSDASAIIQGYACGTGDPATQSTFTFAMPHAEVPFKKFWNDSLASTLSSELSLAAPGCPNN